MLDDMPFGDVDVSEVIKNNLTTETNKPNQNFNKLVDYINRLDDSSYCYGGENHTTMIMESSIPVRYRLLNKKDGSIILQGLFEQRSDMFYSSEWRDLESVVEI